MTNEHYFSADPGSELSLRTISVNLAGTSREVVTAGGMFSPDRLDAGTQVLLTTVPRPPEKGNLLDLGCGWGPVALTLALHSPGATVWAVDVNERALDVVRRNADSFGLTNINATRPENVPEGISFDTIWSNPPIRVGKAELHAMLSHWLPRLAVASDAWLVVQRNLGSDSLHRWLDETLPTGYAVTREETSKGYRVLRVRKD